MSEQNTQILSPDGKYRWDGQVWQSVTPLAPPPVHGVGSVKVAPSHAAPRAAFPQHRNRLVIGVAAAAVVLALVGWLVFAGGGSAKSHVMTGVFTVSDADNMACAVPGASATTQMNNLNDLLDGKTFPCPHGPGGGYSDIGDGTSVSVFDAHGTLIATGNLEGGTASLAGIQFTFTVPGVRDTDMYQVEVANRGKVPFSKATLESNGWAVSLTLG